MELKYAPLTILLYFLAKQKVNKKDEKTHVRDLWDML